MIDHALGKHECISAPLRDVVVTPTVLEILQKGQQELQTLLFGPVHKTLEGWCYQAMKACEGKGDDEVWLPFFILLFCINCVTYFLCPIGCG